MAMDFRIP